MQLPPLDKHNNSRRLAIVSLMIGAFLLVAPGVLAKNLATELGDATSAFLVQAGYNTNVDSNDLPKTLGLIIQGVLSLLGVVFLLYMVYAGVRWMTAGGNTEAVDEAKAAMRNAAIGLGIVLMAYAITLAIFTLAGYGFSTGLTNWGNVDY